MRDAEVGQALPDAAGRGAGRDLGLDGGVEAREGLVQDQQPRLHGERAGDGQPLALAAAEVERPAVRRPRPRARPPPSARARARRRSCASPRPRISSGSDDDLARGEPRVESAAAESWNRSCTRSRNARRAPPRSADTSVAFEADLAARRLLQAGETARQRRLAGARLADQGHDARRARSSRSTSGQGVARPRRARPRGAVALGSGRGCGRAARSPHEGSNAPGGRPAAATSRAGRRSAHAGSAIGQRGSKAQPAGSAPGRAARPRSGPAAARRRPRVPGRADRRARAHACRDAVASPNTWAGVPPSTRRARVHHEHAPGQRGQGAEVVARHEDGQARGAPAARRSRRAHLGLGRGVERGRRLVGQEQAPGRQARACAMTTRWRWPPLSSCG